MIFRDYERPKNPRSGDLWFRPDGALITFGDDLKERIISMPFAEENSTNDTKERLEGSLISFVERASSETANSAEVGALPQVAAVLAKLLSQER